MIEEIRDIPDNINNAYDFVTFLVSKHLPNHQISTSSIMLNMIKDLEYGFVVNGFNTESYSRQKVVDTLNTIIKNHNISITAKNMPDKLNNEDFIQYAQIKDSIK